MVTQYSVIKVMYRLHNIMYQLRLTKVRTINTEPNIGIVLAYRTILRNTDYSVTYRKRLVSKRYVRYRTQLK